MSCEYMWAQSISYFTKEDTCQNQYQYWQGARNCALINIYTVRGIHYLTPGYFLGKILSRKFPSIPIFDNNNILFNQQGSYFQSLPYNFLKLCIRYF